MEPREPRRREQKPKAELPGHDVCRKHSAAHAPGEATLVFPLNPMADRTRLAYNPEIL
jgi:hypothetical protein